MHDRRRPLFAPELIVRVVLAWVMISGLMLVASYGAISTVRFPEPDDVMRLMQVRDLLDGQSWFDVHQYRVDAAGGGVPMHWSRLVDVPIVAAVWFFSLFMTQTTAEVVAGVIVPMVTFGFALLLAGRIAWRLVGAEAAGFACLAMALSVPLISHMRSLRIDHHGWQIVLALLALNGLMARSPRLGGWVAGLALALWVSISVEGLPMAVAICGIAALRWIRDGRGSSWFVHVMGSLAVSSAVIFVGTRGFADLAQHCDAISPVHLAVFAWGGVSAFVLSRCEPIPRVAIVCGLGLIAAGGGAIVFFAAPQCAGGGFVSLDPVVTQFWYRNVGEGMPIWQQSPALALQIVGPPMVGLLAAFKLAAKSNDWLRDWWYDYALLLGAALLVALFVARAGAVAGALAAIPLGWQISQWIRQARNMRRPGRRAFMLAGTALALMPAMPLTILALAMPAKASLNAKYPSQSSCAIKAASGALRALSKGEIIAPFDIAPQLLYETDHSVIATSHHRGNAGMRVVIDLFTGTEEAAHKTAISRGSDYLVLCPDLVEPYNYRTVAPDGFMAQLNRGEVPEWLEPVPIPVEGSMKIWRIKR